jgi:hypothetical protein
MTERVKIDSLHCRLLRDAFDTSLGDHDAFLVFLLLHSFTLVLAGPIIEGRPDVEAVSAVTSRSASEALASTGLDATMKSRSIRTGTGAGIRSGVPTLTPKTSRRSSEAVFRNSKRPLSSIHSS